MATAAASSAAKQLAPHFNIGHKKVFLPSHVVAMLRPRGNISPNFATFKVPLSFNKLDLRDYLWNVYNVRVLSVRSMVNQQMPTTKSGFRGQVYRPLSEKLMIAELEKPFVWPDAPAEKERSDFDYDMWKKFDGEREKHLALRRNMMDNKIPLRTETETPMDRQELAREAKAILEGRKEWKNNAKLDEIWNGMGARNQARTPVAPKKVAEPVGEARDAEIIFEDKSPKRS